MKNSWIGDANLNGVFDSDDFVLGVFLPASTKSTACRATWGQGDWNGDLVFTSGDFVSAFASGGYEVGPRWGGPPLPEPAGVALLLMVLWPSGTASTREAGATTLVKKKTHYIQRPRGLSRGAAGVDA